MRTIVALFLILFMYSCANTKRFELYKLKQSIEYSVKFPDPDNGGLMCNKKREIMTKGQIIQKPQRVDDTTDGIKIIPHPEDTAILKNRYTKCIPDANHSHTYKGEYIFTGADSNLIKYKQKEYWKSSPLKYTQVQWMFQVSTVPFKFRFPIDSVKYDISTSGNLGFVFGPQLNVYKTRNLYSLNHKKDTTFRTQRTNTTSWACGGFLGFTTIKLTPENTGNAVSIERVLLGSNVGAIGVFGFNQFNVGIAIGVDFAFGSNATNWRYQGKPWIGVVLGLKFLD